MGEMGEFVDFLIKMSFKIKIGDDFWSEGVFKILRS